MKYDIDLLIPIILMVSLIYGSEESKEKRALIKHSTVRAAGLFIVFFLCISTCVWLTGITWEKLDDEALQEKWYYNDLKEQNARTEAEERFPEITGKEFLLTGVSEYPSEHGIRYIQWGVSTDGILYIRGYGSVTYLANSYRTAMQEKGLKFKIKKAVVMDGIDSIGEDVFSNLPELKEVEIAGTVEDIGQNAFSYCRKLEKVCLDGYRTSIYPDSFYNCDDLVKIVGNHDVLNDGAAYRTELEFVEKTE